MKDFILDWIISPVESYWWAFIIIWLLWIIVAHIPNFIDFHWTDIWIPALGFFIYFICKLTVCFNLI